MSAFSRLLRRFAKDEGGVFAVIFGVMAIVLVALGGAVVDYVSLEQTRNRAQLALDAAALALQSEINSSGVTTESIRRRAEAIVKERIGDSRVTAAVSEIRVDPASGRLFLGGEFTVPTMFVSLVGVNELSAAFTSEVMRGSMNLEVSLALDVTGSMAGSRITELKAAAKDLVAEILSSNSDEVDARVALVPYSQAVNVSPTYVNALRGEVFPGKTISSIAWTTSTSKKVQSMETGSPVRIRSNGHGFKNNEWVFVTGLSGSGISGLNNTAFQVQNRSNDYFELKGSSIGRASYYSGGSVTKCDRPNCTLLVTSNGHGFADNDTVVITGARGMTGINNKLLEVSERNNNTLVLSGIPAGGGGTYTANSASMFCTKNEGARPCLYYAYTTQAGGQNVAALTDCVTERTGPNAFNDEPPSVTLVGRNYPPANDCPSSAIVPLTKEASALNTAITNLPATGTTAGSLGILWSWYMLSPNFGNVWPSSRPKPYGAPELLKAAIIMTDGDFNTVHFNGVISRDSNEVGNSSTRHTSNSANGTPYAQSRKYCDEMRRVGITVYTVGFGVKTGSDEANMMSYCATDTDKFFLASNGSALKEAFKQIARNISTLRITQ